MTNIQKTHGKGFYKGFLALSKNFPREAAGLREKGRNAFELRTLLPRKTFAAPFFTLPLCKLTVIGKTENKRKEISRI